MLIFSAVISCASAEDVYSLPVDFPPGATPLPSNYLSETEYQDPSLHVMIENGRKDECDYWVARIKISHPSQLRTAQKHPGYQRYDLFRFCLGRKIRKQSV